MSQISHKKCVAAGLPPRTPLGILQRSSDSLAGIKGGEREGKGGEETR